MNPQRTPIRGFYEISIYNPKHEVNVGTVYRNAFCFGAAGISQIYSRYKKHKADTSKAFRHIPFRYYVDIEDFIKHIPKETVLVGVELNHRSRLLDGNYIHPERAIYLFGSEDTGIPDILLDKCDQILQIPSAGKESLNLAVASGIIMWDRFQKNIENI